MWYAEQVGAANTCLRWSSAKAFRFDPCFDQLPWEDGDYGLTMISNGLLVLRNTYAYCEHQLETFGGMRNKRDGVKFRFPYFLKRSFFYFHQKHFYSQRVEKAFIYHLSFYGSNKRLFLITKQLFVFSLYIFLRPLIKQFLSFQTAKYNKKHEPTARD
jgi:hypothetical protein